MEDITREHLKQVIIEQSCVCKKVKNSKGGTVTDIITEVSVDGELVLYSKLDTNSYADSNIKKAINLLLIGKKQKSTIFGGGSKDFLRRNE